MRQQALRRLTPFDLLAIYKAANNGFGYAGRLATAPHTSQVQKNHDVGVWFLVYEANLERIAGDMAKNGKTQEKFEFKGFVNVRLTDQDKATILEVDRPVESLMEDFGALIYSGYKLSLNYDRYSGAQQATLTCVDPECSNYGYAISARHPDLALALATLLYKHFDATAGVWTSASTQPIDRSWD